MKIVDVISAGLTADLNGARVVGVDIGSRSAKGVLLADGAIHTAIIPTGLHMQESAEKLLDKLFRKSGLTLADISYVVGTGYGRIALEFDVPNQVTTEISCHAMGAHYLNSDARTIIDIGGQDSKAIKVDADTGKVVEFVMNDKCAAGTGRFLEKVAGLLDLTMDELGPEAMKAGKPSVISSQCVVFAESEVISFTARGEKREDIAAGIHLSVARRVKNLLSRIGIEPGLVFTGGVSNNVGMKSALEEVLGYPMSEVGIDMVFAGALGAAIYAHKYVLAGTSSATKDDASLVADLTDLENRIAKQQEAIITGANEGRKRVGYLCAYTPQELLNAAGVDHVRLFKAGDAAEVASGEILTQSVFCDLTKSCLGAFKEGDPLSSALDKVYTFYTCDSMKKTAEAIDQFFVPTSIFLLPRLRGRDASRSYFKTELLHFKADLEELAGHEISDGKVREQIALYNRIRGLLRKISELRKRPAPPLTGTDFLDLIRGYYYLPPEELVAIYQEVYQRLAAVSDRGERVIRLMVSGGVVADGDRRVLEIVEKEIGARVVVEDHCTGLSRVYYDIPETGDPYRALAEGYLDQAPCARMKPLEDRLEFSVKLAKEYDVDGIIYSYLKFCPCYGLTKNEFFKHFQQLGIPLLELPTDYSQSDQGQLKTRIEAFIEVLTERGGGRDGKLLCAQAA